MGLRALYEVAAPAKLNLFLHIVGRRADGHHLLQSLFVPIDWCDTLHFERRGDGRIARHDLGDALPADDLCLRAARRLQAESGTGFGVDCSIEKRVPSGAGMGGGSSDAASTLIALNRLWGLDWPRERLETMGLRLGADVPFFIRGRPAWVEGVGERLTPVAMPPAWFGVLKPPSGIDTGALFARPEVERSNRADILAGFAAEAISSALQSGPAAWGRNDLQAAAESVCGEVGEAAELLRLRFGNSRMTGSGSAVFARAGSGAEPSAAMPVVAAPGWAGRMCRSLAEHPLVGWSTGEGRVEGGPPQDGRPV